MLNDLQALAGGVLMAGLGGEFFLRGVVGLARRLRVSAGVIATTIAAFATSSPEFAVAVTSARAGEPEISLGDAVGSNVVNVALILGLALLVAPVACTRSAVARELGTALGLPVILGALAWDGQLSRGDGLLLLALFGCWLTAVVRQALAQRRNATPLPPERNFPLAVAAGIAGLACLLAGGHLIVGGAHGIALEFGIPEFVIGATLVALGTSVPELATAVLAQLRGHQEIGLGTILGSNIFNGFAIVGVTALIHPISTGDPQVSVALGAGALTVAIVLPSGTGVISRGRGVLLLAAYGVYVLAVLGQ